MEQEGPLIIRTINEESFRAARATLEDALQILADPFVIDEDQDDNDGNPRVMFTGQTFAGRMLELGVEYLEGNAEHYYHIEKPTQERRRLYDAQGI